MTNFEKITQSPETLAEMISPYRIEAIVCSSCADKRAHCWEDCKRNTVWWLNQEEAETPDN